MTFSSLFSLFHRVVCLVLLFFGFASLVVPSRVLAQTAPQMYAQGVEAYKNGDTAGAKQKLQLALEIDRNFRPATALLARMAADQRQGTTPAPGLAAKALERTVVPVEFSNTTLTSALESIRQRVAEDSGGKLQINFAVNLPTELANKKITLKMDRVPVLEVLRYIGDMAGVTFEKQAYAIVVTPAEAKPSVPAAGPLPPGTP